MQCSKCKASISINDIECPECGHRQISVKSEKILGYVGIVSVVFVLWSSDFFGIFGNDRGSSNVSATANILATSYRQCEPLFELSQCKADGLFADCLFKNGTRGTADPSRLRAWHYDAQGILLDTSLVRANVTVPPGKSIHVKFYPDNNASRTVICSVDPESPLVADSVRPIR